MGSQPAFLKGLLSWLFKGGFKVSSGSLEWFVGNYCTDLENSEIASLAICSLEHDSGLRGFGVALLIAGWQRAVEARVLKNGRDPQVRCFPLIVNSTQPLIKQIPHI